MHGVVVFLVMAPRTLLLIVSCLVCGLMASHEWRCVQSTSGFRAENIPSKCEQYRYNQTYLLSNETTPVRLHAKCCSNDSHHVHQPPSKCVFVVDVYRENCTDCNVTGRVTFAPDCINRRMLFGHSDPLLTLLMYGNTSRPDSFDSMDYTRVTRENRNFTVLLAGLRQRDLYAIGNASDQAGTAGRLIMDLFEADNFQYLLPNEVLFLNVLGVIALTLCCKFLYGSSSPTP
ncbi:membrane glycoprotein UL40 [Aotine betaherpesvirus 1]|uniref:Membrane glycoprotein UL40 n=1 Tax=Aotine betaherpesvirus 1 TaxID=50290 RepID=G8XUB4_9BETA|nr:membrane glycoprotein UL40 [Aotine betaherpesvirus 1]AEV80745.1 membrane glycoprotein UL40 [Aotine betaherpesvirus 1]